jgi:hypothetical protein
MGVMVMAMVTDITAILMATMEAIVVGIVVTMVQGMDPVMGDEIREQGECL